MISWLVAAVVAVFFVPGSQPNAHASTEQMPQAATGLPNLTFVRGKSLRESYVWRTKTDGSVVRLVRGFGPAWSPDGRELAYIALRPKPPDAGMETDIFVISADGRHRRRLTNDIVQESSLEWSPTGKEIAYSAGVARGGAGDVFVSNRDGGHLRRLTRTAFSCERPAGWTRDGRSIRFTYCVTGAVYELKATGGPKRRLRALPADPVWSADGRSIAYFASNGEGLFVADADGKNPRQIAPIHGGGALAWSPDGRTLAFQGDARDGCGAVEYRSQLFLVASLPDSTPTPRECVEGWESNPTWQPVRR